MEASGIIAAAQQADLVLEEQRIKNEREQRRILRLQSQSPGVPIGELVAKLASELPDPAQEREESNIIFSKERMNERTQASFPPPPTSPNSNSGA